MINREAVVISMTIRPTHHEGDTATISAHKYNYNDDTMNYLLCNVLTLLSLYLTLIATSHDDPTTTIMVNVESVRYGTRIRPMPMNGYRQYLEVGERTIRSFKSNPP